VNDINNDDIIRFAITTLYLHFQNAIDMSIYISRSRIVIRSATC